MDKLINTANNTQYWICSAGDNNSKWAECYEKGIILLGFNEVGNYSQYKNKDEIENKFNDILNDGKRHYNNATAVWEFANEVMIGDIIFIKNGLKKVIARGIIKSDYKYDERRDDGYNSYREVEWTNVGEYDHPGQAVLKTLTNITQYEDYYPKLEALFNENVNLDETSNYSINEFLDEVYMASDEYNRLKNLLLHKKNIILQGPPGVGKTFVGTRLAYSILGNIDKDKVMTVQFHQSYSYEDFIMGYRPKDNGFELKYGTFYNFCEKARADKENPYFIIIDEINRGNLSKIFGELFMLIEPDKRNIEIPLLYEDKLFSVPDNLHIIGTMNTADRSLAIIDYALRRRFSFYTLTPKLDHNKFISYYSKFNNNTLNRLIKKIIELNEDIKRDETLKKDFMIGHSYFSNLDTNNLDEQLENIVEYDIIPLLEEYWFDNDNKFNTWARELRSVLND